MFGRSKLRRYLAAGATVAVMAATSTIIAAPPAGATPQTLVNDPFTAATTSAPVLGRRGTAGFPCLTAGTDTSAVPIPACTPPIGDTPGSGALRFTKVATDESSGVVYNTNIPTEQGLSITFNQYQYGGTGADGISAFLAVAPPQPASIGLPGGSLGYAGGPQEGRGGGLPGGYLGIGLDVYGNFSTSGSDGSNCGVPGSATRMPNQVVVRGPGNGTTGYCLLSSSANDHPAALGGSGTQLHGGTRAGSKRGVRVLVDPTARTYTVGIDPSGGSSYSTVTSGSLPGSYFDPASPSNAVQGIPPRITFGFAASTGAVTDVHEVSDVVITTLYGEVPVLGLTKSDNVSGSARPGTGFTYQLTPSVQAGAGAAETQPHSLKITDPMPQGVTPDVAHIATLGTFPGGGTWDCSTSTPATITCLSQGNVNIPAGTALPQVNIPVTLAAGAVGGTALVNTATISSVDAAQPVPATDTVTVAVPAGVTAGLTADNPNVLPGAITVPPANLPATAIGGPSAGPPAGSVSSTPIHSINLQALNGVQASPIHSIPIHSIPIASIPIASIPIHSIGALRAALLSDISVAWPAGCSPTPPATPCTGWQGLLAGTALAVNPLQSLSLYDVLANPDAQAKLGTLKFGDLDLSATPIASIPIASIMLASTPIASIPLPGSATGATNVLQAWCTELQQLGHPCAALAIDPANPSSAANTTLFTLALAGVPIASIPIASIPIASIDLTATPIASIPIASIDIGSTPIASIPIHSINIDTIRELFSLPIASIANPSFITCRPACTTLGQAFDTAGGIVPGTTIGQLGVFNGATFGELAANPAPNVTNPFSNIFLPDVLRGLLSKADYPWQALDLQTAPLQQAATSGGQVVLRESLAVTGSGQVPVSATIGLPNGFVYLPGSATLDSAAIPDPGPTSFAQSFAHTSAATSNPGPGPLLPFSLSLAAGAHTLRVTARPGITLGSYLATASAVTGSNPPSTASTQLTVTESPDNDGTPATATPLLPDNINLSYLNAAAQLDHWAIAVPDGAQLSLSLSNLPADYDMVLYSPSVAPLRAAPQQVLPPVTDNQPTLTPGADAQPPPVTGDVPLDPTLSAYAIAATRGTADEHIDTPPLRGGTYIVQVSGYNGAFSPQPYVIRAKITQAASSAPCAARTFAFPTPGFGSAPAIPAGTNTLFLVNTQRLVATYGPTRAAAVMTAMNAAAADSAAGVIGAVVPVDSDPAVRAAYASWDQAGNRCLVNSANAVVSAIANLIDSIRAAHPSVVNLVMNGADDQLPMARVPDTTTLSNERDYASSFAGNNELVASLAGGFTLTDDPYANRIPLGVGAGSLFLPEIAVGRLVESPEQIAAALNRFVATQGVLTAASGLSTGYDFLTGGAKAVASALQVDLKNVTGANISQLINDTWTRAQLTQALTTPPAPSLASVNAHFDFSRALPAVGNTTGDQSSLVQTTDIPAPPSQGSGVLAGSLLFSMGCHAGLNVPDTLGASTATWAKTFADQGALWVANTGFGYGDTSTIALSARLMAGFAQRLDGSTSVGAALAFAKQRYAADTATISGYDMKALMEATFYGLPMYHLNVGAPPVPPPPSPPSIQIDPATGLQTAPLQVAPNFQLAPGGGYYTANGMSQTTQNRPIEPLATIDVTQPGTPPGTLGLIAHGALITSLTSTDQGGFAPTYGRPTVDSTGHEPPTAAGDASYPSAAQRVATFLAPDGAHQQVAMVVGQFLSGPPAPDGTPGPGTQRLFTNVGTLVYYDPPGSHGAADFTPPTIASTVAQSVGSSVAFTVRTSAADPLSPVKRVLVLYTDALHPGSWTAIDLGQSQGGAWTGGGPGTASGKADYIVQSVDGAGNIAVSSNKAVDFNALAPPVANPNLGMSLASGSPQAGSIYTGPVTITIAGGTQVTVSVDGGPFVPYTVPLVISADGVHDIKATDLAGDNAETLFVIDSSGPATYATVVPATNQAGWSRAGAKVVISAADAGGSGVKSITWSLNGGSATTVNTAQVTIPLTIAGTNTFTFSAVDNAGNQGAGNTFVVKFDAVPPTVTCGGAPVEWSITDISVPCTATDATSGLAPPAQAAFSLSTAVPAGTETSTAATNSVTVCDVAGNCAPPVQVTGLKVDKKAPVISLTAPSDNAVYEVGQKVNAAYSCTDGGSGVSSCAGGMVGSGGAVTPVASGEAIDTATPGVKTFQVLGRDAVGNQTTTTVTYTVTYRICPVLVSIGSSPLVATINLTICSASGQDLGQPGIALESGVRR